MKHFDLREVQAAVNSLTGLQRRFGLKYRIAYCAHCQCDRPCVYLSDNLPLKYRNARICRVCGFSPGEKPRVANPQLRTAVYAADNYECVYCGATEQLTLDHVIPHANGGLTTFDNLRTACRSCNCRRGDVRRETHPRFGRFRGAK